MCAWIAYRGNSGIGACAACFDMITCPSGIFRIKGLFASCRLSNEVLITKKLPVVPESGIVLIVCGCK